RRRGSRKIERDGPKAWLCSVVQPASALAGGKCQLWAGIVKPSQFADVLWSWYVSLHLPVIDPDGFKQNVLSHCASVVHGWGVKVFATHVFVIASQSEWLSQGVSAEHGFPTPFF